MINEFISKLKEFASNDVVKFYCPINKKYYYIDWATTGDSGLIIYITPKEQLVEYRYKDIIRILNNVNNTSYRKSREIVLQDDKNIQFLLELK
jgi:hypothetical protein